MTCQIRDPRLEPFLQARDGILDCMLAALAVEAIVYEINTINTMESRAKGD